jgi:hypothetical protein
MARYARRDPDATDEHDEHDHDDHNELEPGEDRVRALVY